MKKAIIQLGFLLSLLVGFVWVGMKGEAQEEPNIRCFRVELTYQWGTDWRSEPLAHFIKGTICPMGAK